MAETLKQVIVETGDWVQPYGKGDEVQVFCSDESRARYYRLSDYAVTGTAGGPSITLWPRRVWVHRVDQKGGS